MSSVTITVIVILLVHSIITTITLCGIENRIEHIEQLLLDKGDTDDK